MVDTEEKLMEEKLDGLYQEMLKDIVTFMDEKKITLKDLCEKTLISEEELESYFSLEKKNFSIYHELLRVVKEW